MGKLASLMVLASALFYGWSAHAQVDPCNSVYRGSMSNGEILKLTLTPTGNGGTRVRMVINRDPARYGFGSCQADSDGNANVGFDVDGFNGRGQIYGTEFSGGTANGLNFDLFRE